MSKKIRCFSIRSDYDGCELLSMKEALEDFGLHVDLGEQEAQSARHDPTCEVIVSDAILDNYEIDEIREFWPPCHDWTKPNEDSVNNDNDVK